MTRHADTLKWAISQLGQTEHPAGSNRGEFVEYCQSHTWLKGTGWPWCAAFVVTAIIEGGGIDYPDKTAGAWDMLERGRRRGWALPASAVPTPGDIVAFNIGSGHVGIVERVARGIVYSIDGNAGDQVRRCERRLEVVRGYVHWPETLAGVKRPRRPVAQVVGSASGRRQLVVGKARIRLPDKVT